MAVIRPFEMPMSLAIGIRRGDDGAISDHGIKTHRSLP